MPLIRIPLRRGQGIGAIDRDNPATQLGVRENAGRLTRPSGICNGKSAAGSVEALPQCADPFANLLPRKQNHPEFNAVNGRLTGSD
jgi:hypothetical protein